MDFTTRVSFRISTCASTNSSLRGRIWNKRQRQRYLSFLLAFPIVLGSLGSSRSTGWIPTDKYSRATQTGTAAAFHTSSSSSSFGPDLLNTKMFSSSSRSLSCLDLDCSKPFEQHMEEVVERCIPPLSSKSHKGSSGRVGVLGGSARYTGAPYYAAMAGLKIGMDLAFVFCAEEAAIPIKCYSPELMVAPVYNAKEFDRAVALSKTYSNEQEENHVDGNGYSKRLEEEKECKRLVDEMVSEVVSLFQRMHVLIIGPGLGRCPLVLRATARIIQAAKEIQLPLVIDADGLFLLTQPPYQTILSGYDRAILTPNAIEMKRLLNVTKDSTNNTTNSGQIQNTNALEGTIIVQKGKHDVIISTYMNDNDTLKDDDDTQNPISNTLTLTLTCKEEGGLKRSGGIGDILAGVIGAFVAWNEILKKEENDAFLVKQDLMLACWSACCITKRSTFVAFERKRRSMTAPDILDDLGCVFNLMTTTTTSSD